MDSYPDPSLIGKTFVKQYYTQLHRDPTQMHRFYLEQSSFVHGGSEMGSAERVVGQKVCLIMLCLFFIFSNNFFFFFQ